MSGSGISSPDEFLVYILYSVTVTMNIVWNRPVVLDDDDDDDDDTEWTLRDVRWRSKRRWKGDLKDWSWTVCWQGY